MFEFRLTTEHRKEVNWKAIPSDGGYVTHYFSTQESSPKSQTAKCPMLIDNKNKPQKKVIIKKVNPLLPSSQPYVVLPYGTISVFFFSKKLQPVAFFPL